MTLHRCLAASFPPPPSFVGHTNSFGSCPTHRPEQGPTASARRVCSSCARLRLAERAALGGPPPPLHPRRFEIARLASRERQDGHQSSQTPLAMPVLAASASRHAAVLGLLACSALWGTLARLGLSALNSYDGHSIAPVIWAQGVGCFVMGWALGNRGEIESRCVPTPAALALVEGNRRRGAARGRRCRTASTPAVLTPALRPPDTPRSTLPSRRGFAGASRPSVCGSWRCSAPLATRSTTAAAACRM